MGCHVKCLFGISESIKGIDPDLFSPHMYRDYAYLTVGGPGRVYWFLFENLPKTVYYADEVPRYTKEDQKEMIEKHWSDKVVDDITLGDLYSNSICTNMTPLHEHIFDKWHFQRMIIIGDSAHKVGRKRLRAEPRKCTRLTVL